MTKILITIKVATEINVKTTAQQTFLHILKCGCRSHQICRNFLCYFFCFEDKTDLWYYTISKDMCEWQLQDTDADKGIDGQSAANKHTPGFQCSFVKDLWILHLAEPSLHSPCSPAFTFHKDRRRLSVSVEHRAKLNIFSLYLYHFPLPFSQTPWGHFPPLAPSCSLPACTPPPHLCVWPLIAFSLPHKSPHKTVLVLVGS